MRNLKYPLVTYSVVVTCVVVYLLQLISHNKIDYSLFFIPERIIDNFEVWRLFTPAIMHFGVMHILFNVMIFNFFGSMIERDYGPSKLLLMFFGFSAVSNFFQYLFTQNYLFESWIHSRDNWNYHAVTDNTGNNTGQPAK